MGSAWSYSENELLTNYNLDIRFRFHASSNPPQSHSKLGGLEVCKSSDQAWEPEKSNALHPPFVLKLSRFYITQFGTNPGKTSATIISRENVAFLSF